MVIKDSGSLPASLRYKESFQFVFVCLLACLFVLDTFIGRVAICKVLRCTFFGEWKNSCSLKFVQLELLNKAKARSSKKRAA